MAHQNFLTIADLENYIDTYVKPNGINAITGDEANTAFNGLADFIIKSMVNGKYAKNQTLSSGTLLLPVGQSVNYISVAPTNINWNPDFQNEYYIVNATGTDIPTLTSYTDAFGAVLNLIPARTAVHIAQGENGTWYQINNVGGSGGSGGLPPQTGHAGQFLGTDGTSAIWLDPHLTIKSSDFQSDGKTYINALFPTKAKVSIFWPDVPNFIYTEKGDWHYGSGSIIIDLPQFNASTNPNLTLELFLKKA